MGLLKYTNYLQRGAATTHAIKNDPFGIVFDTLVRFVVGRLFPIPFASELVIYFKGPIFAFLLGLITFAITGIIIVVTLVLAPSATIRSVGSFVPFGQELQVAVQALAGYKETGFVDTNMPTKNPFGGVGEEYSVRTAGFHDLEYFRKFGLIHEGQDLIPSENYYAGSNAYKLTGQPIVFATLTGNATTYTDSEGSLTVAITNEEQSMRTVYMHFKQVLACNCQVHAGEPIGIMGDTGFSFGEHLHYEVRRNEGGNWVAINPLSYIK